MSNRTIVVSAEVRRLLGDQATDQFINNPPFQSFDCDVCGKRGSLSAGRPVSLSLQVSGDTIRSRLTHERCAPSRVIHLREGIFDEQLQDMNAKRIIWGETPTYVFGPDAPAFGQDDAGKMRDVWLDGFRRMGFVVLTDNFRPTEPLPGWRLEISDQIYTLCTSDGKTIVIRFGEVAQAWLDALWRWNACLAITGSTLFIEPEELQEERLRRLVNEGQAVGAVVKAVRRD